MLTYFQPIAVAVLRLFVASLVWQFAARRLFGMFGGEPAVILTPAWFLGNLELVAALALGLGFLARPAALVIALDMFLIYLIEYLPRGFPPTSGNLGEPYFQIAVISAFLACAGPGRFSVDADLKATRPDVRLPWTLDGLQAYYPHALGAARILLGLLFIQHGLPKIGIGGDAAAFLSQRWIAGVIEVFGGAAIAAGLFTRSIAFVSAGQMAFAYFLSHAPRALSPIENGGDRPALFCFFFLTLTAAGPGLWAADRFIGGRRRG